MFYFFNLGYNYPVNSIGPVIYTLYICIKSKSIQMKVLCTTKQVNLIENKLYKVIEVKPRNKSIFYKVICEDNKCRWYESTVFRYPHKMPNF